MSILVAGAILETIKVVLGVGLWRLREWAYTGTVYFLWLLLGLSVLSFDIFGAVIYSVMLVYLRSQSRSFKT